MGKSQQQEKDNDTPVKHCLNCGTELNGMYCHECGQQATDKMPTVGAFIVEYLNNAFIWDSKFIKTIWTLIRRPGHLTSEFLSGKFVSQEHPLKLNMFLLFVFVTLFLIFSGTEKMNSSVHNLTTDERVFPGIQMKLLMDDEEYALTMKESELDTVQILAPLFLADSYPEIIRNHETIKDTGGEALDIWVAILPKVLVDDKIIIPDPEGYYIFNPETHTDDVVGIFNDIWTELVNLLAKYLPLIVLFTAPFLSISLRFVQRKNRLPQINHFIFALHYTAFIELLMLCIYIIYLLVSPPLELLQYIVAIGSCVYLTIAFHHVYKTDSWIRAVVKALIISIIYILICLMMFFTIFMVASFSVIASL